MVSLGKLSSSFGGDEFVRALLILNNSVALSLGAATGQTIFIVMAPMMGVSTLFNLAVALSAAVPKRGRRALPNDVPCPSNFVLGMDVLGAVTFLVLYVGTMVKTAASDGTWEPTLMMAYSSIGALVAMVMHACMAVVNLRRYIRYQHSFGSWCPHCHQPIGGDAHDEVRGEIRITSPVRQPGSPPSPVRQPASPPSPRHSLCANAEGEAEGDALILKV